MSWLFSQALVEEYLGGICLDGEQSVPLNGNNTQLVYLPQDKMTDFSRLSRFGMTFKPLTENLGEELLMSFLGDFHAKISAQPVQVMGLTEKEVECGERWQGLLAKLDPNTLLWKTPQCSLLEDSEQSLEIWPNWGTMRNGVCWEQPMLAQNTNAIEFGLLPTPVTSDYKGTSQNSKFQSRKIQYQAWDNGENCTTLYPNPLVYEALMGWPQGWTDLKPLEMDKSHCVQQQHGNY
jgi:hypothetical protein